LEPIEIAAHPPALPLLQPYLRRLRILNPSCTSAATARDRDEAFIIRNVALFSELFVT
jgi:hypothetical protein